MEMKISPNVTAWACDKIHLNRLLLKQKWLVLKGSL